MDRHAAAPHANAHGSRAFVALVVGAAAFVWLSGRAMPDIVAAHFGPGGTADGFMPRGGYLTLMLVMVAVVPWLLAVLPARTLRKPDARINLPHPEYWLAPARRADTVDFLARRMRHFAAMLTVFLCLMHWQVVQANALSPPMLSSSRFVGTIAVFLLVTMGWVFALLRHFKYPPRVH